MTTTSSGFDAALVSDIRAASRRATDWVLAQQHDSGVIGDPRHGFKYYRGPWTLSMMGEVGAGEYDYLTLQQVQTALSGGLGMGASLRSKVDDKGKISAWLTLTTCHPKFSSRQRLVVFAELVDGPNYEAIVGA